jgi:hypothetical protein
MEAFMIRPAALLAVLLVFPGRVALAQTPPPHAPDGTTRAMVTSIVVPPLPNAPFSATVNTEWTRSLENGATMVVKNHRLIARDAQGRIFQERRFLVPERDGQSNSRLTQTEVADPVTHTAAYCNPYEHMCELRFYGVPATPAVRPVGPSPDGTSNLTRDDLGTQTVNGLQIVGTREVLTVNGSLVGTDRPLSITKEFWYSRRLGLNLVTKRMDPRNGVELFTLTDINLTEPDPSLFVLPKGVRIVDNRTLAPPQ